MFGFTAFKKHLKEFAVFFVLIIICLSMLTYSGSQNETFKPKKAGMDILSMCQRSIAYTGRFFTGTVNSIAELHTLRKEYQELTKQMEEYQFMEKNYLELFKENQELKRQLGYMAEGEIEKISATILGGKTNNFFSSVIINQGENKGIRKNMPVIAYSGGFPCLVGKVVETSRYSSIIKPITDHSFYVPAKLQKLRYEGLVRGSGPAMDSPLTMNYISKRMKNDIAEGDIVVTSGNNDIYPENIYIGTVSGISAKEYESSLELELQPFIDFHSLKYVFVLKIQGETDEK